MSTDKMRCWKCKRVRDLKYMNIKRHQCGPGKAVCKNLANRRKRNNK